MGVCAVVRIVCWNRYVSLCLQVGVPRQGHGKSNAVCGGPRRGEGCTARLHGLTQALAPFTHIWKLHGLSHPRHELFI